MTISCSDISEIRIFNGLSQDELQRIASRLEKCNYLSGTLILAKETPVAELYVILSGKVRVELQGLTGQILNLTEMGAGDVIGERAILTDEPRTANVRAISDVVAARLHRSDFEELLHETVGFDASSRFIVDL